MPRFGVNRFTPAFDARVIYTNNPGPDEKTGLIHHDTVVEVQPSVVFERHGPHLSLTGNLAVSAIDYADHSHPGRLLPRGRVDFATKVIDGLAYFDGYARVDPTFEDPFVTRPGDSISYKLEPRTRYSLSPYILKHFGDTSTLQMRTDYTSTRITDVSTPANIKTTSTSLDNTISFERQPTPFGYTLLANSHNETDERVEQPVMKTRNGRLWLDYALDPQVAFGVVAGREEATFIGSTVQDSFFGGRVRLRPSERTDLRVMLERRYFGDGWDAIFEHRSPYVVITLQSARTVTSQDVPQLTFGANSNIADLLNQSLLTRFPDPAARQQEVDRIVAANNLPQSSPTELTFSSIVPQVRQNASANISLRGRRNVIYLQYGYLKTQGLPQLSQTNLVQSRDVLQQALAMGWNSRLTPLTTFSAAAEVGHTKHLDGGMAYSEQRTVRSEVMFALSPRASVTLGARVLTVRATPGFLNNNDLTGEKAVYLGVRQRF